eukprot:4896514-Pyramimonas_sp.AAC.1
MVPGAATGTIRWSQARCGVETAADWLTGGAAVHVRPVCDRGAIGVAPSGSASRSHRRLEARTQVRQGG